VTKVWLVVAGSGLATAAIKAAGPVLLGGRPLPDRLAAVVTLIGPAVLAALVAINTFGDGRALTLDERAIGVGVAGIAVWRRAPVLVVVAVAAATTALVRMIG
jgi:branched-subunit amino acid transport protein